MIAKHSMEQSQKGEGVEVVENKPHEVNVVNLYFETESIFNLKRDYVRRRSC